MRVSYKWLAEVVDLTGITPQVLAERLTNAGVAVDAVTPRVENISGVVVGHVLTCAPHPDADRLKVCTVDVGASEPLSIVCGAPNVVAGQKVPTALVGAALPGNKAIGSAKLRGVESRGMLCSAAEIGLETKWLGKDQTEGLYILPDDAPVGADVAHLLMLDDTLLELDLTPNRADCMSIRGLAYEISAILERPLSFPQPAQFAQSASNSPITVELRTPLCTRYEAQVMDVTGLKPSPLWMQMRLLAMGVRPISMIVDVTNYVMLEWGQPLHAFNLEEVGNNTIVVRQGQPGETLVTLDGETRMLTEDTIVIADTQRAIGIAGIMGGENSEIVKRTRAIVIESAAFNAASVRRTGQRLGLRSEAQQRFEKGIDYGALEGALLRATELLATVGGALPVGGIVRASGETGATSGEGVGTTVEFSPRHCNDLLGTSIPPQEMEAIFHRLGFTVTAGAGDSSPWLVGIPTRRPDIAIEADLVEEVGRLHGFDAIPSTLMQDTSVGVRTPWQTLCRHTRNLFVGAGLTEVFPYTFGHPQVSEALRLTANHPLRRMIPLLRPMSEERQALRTHLLPGLAGVARYNLDRGVSGGRIFEIGRVYLPDALPLQSQPQEPMLLGALWFGQEEATLGLPQKEATFYTAKGVLETWLESLGLLSDTHFQVTDDSWLHPGRAAKLVINNQTVGSLGELHPETAAALELGRAIYAQVDLELISRLQSPHWTVARLPRYPSVRRDLAVVVAEEVKAGELLNAAAQAADAKLRGCLESARVFDVYTGQHVAAGAKSVAVALVFRSAERTLTDDEVEAAIDAVLRTWKTEYGAELRK